jgi:hypothetical protein
VLKADFTIIEHIAVSSATGSLVATLYVAMTGDVALIALKDVVTGRPSHASFQKVALLSGKMSATGGIQQSELRNRS